VNLSLVGILTLAGYQVLATTEPSLEGVGSSTLGTVVVVTVAVIVATNTLLDFWFKYVRPPAVPPLHEKYATIENLKAVQAALDKFFTEQREWQATQTRNGTDSRREIYQRLGALERDCAARAQIDTAQKESIAALRTDFGELRAEFSLVRANSNNRRS
jgi:hypothetical protein